MHPTHTQVAVTDLVKLLDQIVEVRGANARLVEAVDALLGQFSLVTNLELFTEVKAALDGARKAGL